MEAMRRLVRVGVRLGSLSDNFPMLPLSGDWNKLLAEPTDPRERLAGVGPLLSWPDA